jgi:hypothetical protein
MQKKNAIEDVTSDSRLACLPIDSPLSGHSDAGATHGTCAQTQLAQVSRPEKRLLLLLTLLFQYMTAFDGISHLSKSNHRKMSQSPFLVGGKGLIKRPPRIGELLKVSSSLC